MGVARMSIGQACRQPAFAVSDVRRSQRARNSRNPAPRSKAATTYQPASRYWRFQATETAIYLALALALTGYCFRRLSRLS
jgi:hypothetical protein